MANQEINSQFSINDVLRFEIDEHGMLIGIIESPQCSGRFYLHGAHVTSFCPRDQSEMLFVSEKAVFSDGKAIRGGVPICFPWFSNHTDDPKAPAHGKARTKKWEISSTEQIDDRVVITLSTMIDSFGVVYTIGFGGALCMTLSVTNHAATNHRFEAALHSYFAISNIHAIEIDGLKEVAFLDQLTNQKIQPTGKAICFMEETDRIYQGSASPIAIIDKEAKRRIVLESRNSTSTVVWNPWTAKAERMADFGNDEWRRTCCVETANIKPNDIALRPGETHEMTAIHRLVRLQIQAANL